MHHVNSSMSGQCVEQRRHRKHTGGGLNPTLATLSRTLLGVHSSARPLCGLEVLNAGASPASGKVLYTWRSGMQCLLPYEW